MQETSTYYNDGNIQLSGKEDKNGIQEIMTYYDSLGSINWRIRYLDGVTQDTLIYNLKLQ